MMPSSLAAPDSDGYKTPPDRHGLGFRDGGGSLERASSGDPGASGGGAPRQATSGDTHMVGGKAPMTLPNQTSGSGS
jgi:hypothetical protein